MITYTITLDAGLALWEKGYFSDWFKDTSNTVYHCRFYDEEGVKVDDMVLRADDLLEFPFGDYRKEAEEFCKGVAKLLSEGYMFCLCVCYCAQCAMYVYKTQEKALERARKLFKEYANDNHCDDDLQVLYDEMEKNPFGLFRLEDIDIEIKKFKEGDDIL